MNETGIEKKKYIYYRNSMIGIVHDGMTGTCSKIGEVV